MAPVPRIADPDARLSSGTAVQSKPREEVRDDQPPLHSFVDEPVWTRDVLLEPFPDRHVSDEDCTSGCERDHIGVNFDYIGVATRIGTIARTRTG